MPPIMPPGEGNSSWRRSGMFRDQFPDNAPRVLFWLLAGSAMKLLDQPFSRTGPGKEGLRYQVYLEFLRVKSADILYSV